MKLYYTSITIFIQEFINFLTEKKKKERTIRM